MDLALRTRLPEQWPEYIPSPDFVASFAMLGQEPVWYMQSDIQAPLPTLQSHGVSAPSGSFLQNLSPTRGGVSNSVPTDAQKPETTERRQTCTWVSKDIEEEPFRSIELSDGVERSKLARARAEKKYRENLNFRLDQLRQTLETVRTRLGSPRKNDTGRFPTLIGDRSPHKRKEDVLIDAIAFVQAADAEIQHLKAELDGFWQPLQGLPSLCRDFPG